MALTAETYRRIMREDSDGAWELIDGRLREKPAMTLRQADVGALLAHQLMSQLDLSTFRVHINGARVKYSDRTFFVPDLVVIPFKLIANDIDRPDALDFYNKPLPLTVEIWSPSTGDYAVDAKLRTYRARGDLEIWRIHPYDRILTTWRRQQDGKYLESTYIQGSVSPASISGVTVDLARLFM